MKPRSKRSDLGKQNITVLQLMGDGFNTKQIAAIMNRSPKTVEFHRAELFRILRLQSTAQAIKMAVGFGLTSLCLILFAGVLSAAPPQNLTNKTWSAAFDYPTNYMAAIAKAIAVPGMSTNALTMTQLTNVTYRFYLASQFQGTNTQWSLILTTNNPPPLPDNSSIQVRLPSLTLQQVFLCASISNLFGEFFFTAPSVLPLVPPDVSTGYSLQASP